MIVFNKVNKNYGTNVGLKDATVHIEKGDFVFLVGPSGAGKTTFVRLILKEIEADSGTILVGGRDVTRMTHREIPELRQQIGMVFQDFRLLEKKIPLDEAPHCRKTAAPSPGRGIARSRKEGG